MIFSKKINIIHGIIVVILIIISAFMIISVNKRFPKAPIVTNEESGYVMVNNLKVSPVECKLYTPDEFNEEFPTVMYYKYLSVPENAGKYKDKDQYRIVYYKVKATNETKEDIRFMLAEFYAISFPTYWSNGIPIIPGPIKVKAGESAEFAGIALITPNLAGYKDASELEDDTFGIIFQGYPEEVILKFDKAS